MQNIIIAVTAAFVAGIWCADFLRLEFTVLVTVAAILLGAALWQIRDGSRYIAATVLGLFFIAGMIRFNHAAIESPFAVSRFAGQQATVSGSIAALPQWSDLDERLVKVRYVVEARMVKVQGSEPQPANGAVTLTLIQPRTAPRAAYGDNVVVSGNIAALRGYQNPGRIDSAASLRLQGITARMTASAETFAFRPSGSRPWQTVIAGWRQSLTANIRAAMGPGDAAILTGVLFGGYSGIKQEVVKDFAATGLVHLLSVSGTHIALVAGLAIWLGGRLGLRRGTGALLAGVCTAVYALLAGLSPPVVRSLVMGLVALAAVGLGREKDSLQALGLAALGMLACQPGLIYDVSFQLTFGAAAGLVLLYTKTVQYLVFLPRRIAAAIAVTLTAQLGVLPVLAWYFNSFPVSSFLANILIVPPLEAVLAVGLAGSMIGLVVPVAGKLLLIGCALVIGAVVKLTAIIAALPASTVHLPQLGLVGGAAYYAALLWVYGYLPKAVPGPKMVLRRWPYKTAAVSALAIALVIIRLYYPRPVQVHFIDVGQGDASLVRTPHGRAVLIDSGGGELSDFDVGGRVVAPYLKHYNITAVDYLILTHGHKDHAGGAASVADAVPVRRIIAPRASHAPALQALAHAVQGQGFIEPVAGQQLVLDGVNFTIEHAAQDSGPDRGNETSNVIRVSYGRHSFLITGDIGEQGERAMLARGLAAGSVLKVSHHGARTSTTPEFLAAYAPQYAVISAGYNNRFGHPHPETLQRLTGQNVRLYRTDRDGAVVFSTDGEQLAVETFVKGRGADNTAGIWRSIWRGGPLKEALGWRKAVWAK